MFVLRSYNLESCITVISRANHTIEMCHQVLDLCLSMGSKDNMTTLVIKFPAQSVGTGGGVTARRQASNSKLQPKGVHIIEPEPEEDASRYT